MAKPKKSRGRPSDFRKEFIEQAQRLCALGATDREVAEFFGVSEVTINAWKHRNADFLNALKLGKEASDDRVEKSLYRRAIGYSFDAVKILQSNGEPVYAPYVEHVPPDTTACIFWLKNRRRGEWRDKIDHEMTGKDGGPIRTEDVSSLELARRVALLLSQATEVKAA